MMGFEPGATKFKDVKLPRIRVGVRVAEPAPVAPSQDKALAALQADLARVKRALAKVQQKLRDRSFARALAVEVDRTALQRMLDEMFAETGVTGERITGMQRSPGPLAAARLTFCLRAKAAGFTDRQNGLFMSGRSPAAISTFLKRARGAGAA